LFVQSAELFFVAADVAGDCLETAVELVDLDGQAGEGERFAGLLAVFFDERPELGAAVEGGPADAGEGGDGVGGDGFAVGSVTVRIIWRVLFTLSGGLADHLFEVPAGTNPPGLQRCNLMSWIPPDNSNRTRHLIRAKPAI